MPPRDPHPRATATTVGLARSLLLAALALLSSAAPASPREAPDLVAAAIAGDAATVRRLLDAGTPVDTADRWGGTALAFAASEGRVEVVRLLLDRGADPSKRETFFDQSPLARALGGGPFTEGLSPERLEIAFLLLRHGADDRELALETAIARGNLELGRAAIESGPMYASNLEELGGRAAKRGQAFIDLVAGARSRADPPPPRLGPAELARFAGRFEVADADDDATIRVDGDDLVIEGLADQPLRVVASGKSTFRSSSGEVEVSFFGRAGLVEGASIEAKDRQWGLRRSVADPVPGASARVASRSAEPGRSDPAGSSRAPSAPATPANDEAVAAATDASWPGFRGRDGSGVADGPAPPAEWDLASGKGVWWKAAVPGLGNSSPIVAGGRVFVTTAVSSGESAGIRTGATGAGTEVDEAVEHRWLVLAFDQSTGAKLWETEVGRGLPASRRHMKATQANSTPTTDGRRIVAVFPTAGLAVLDLEGRPQWKRDLGPLRAGAFNDPTLEWGFASSPVLYRNTVILQVDIHDGPYLAAWDLDNGRELWRTPRDGVAPSWATPVLWPTPDGVEVVANASNIRGYSAADGRELWRLGPTSEQVVATPIVAGGILYVSAGYPPVKPIYAVKPGLRGTVDVVPGVKDARLLWSDDRGGAYMPSPLFYRGQLYIVHHNGRLVSYDATSGEALYKARFSQSGTFTSSPVAADGRIYTGTEEGSIYVVEAGPVYRELAVNDMTEPVMATPAIADGVLYVRTPSALIALGGPRPRNLDSSRYARRMGFETLHHGVQFARAHGAIAAARYVPYWLSDRYHERGFGVATAVAASLESYGRCDPLLSDYMAPTYRTLKRVLRFVDIRPWSVFLDYGCGRGRALVVASTLPFAKVIGVEIVPELLVDAQTNLERAAARLRCRSHELVHADAADYVPPVEVDNIYFFNPFRGEVLAAAIANIEASLRLRPRPLTIVYLNADNFSGLARTLPWLELTHELSAYPQTYTAIYRARPERLG